MAAQESRETLGTRLGFLLIAAGCAVGLGNVWRFPYITGEYGGAWFLIIFIVFQIAVMPVMILEFAVGRASRRNMGLALKVLQPKGGKWHFFSWFPFVGSYGLLSFYTIIAGWMLVYCWYMLTGTFTNMAPADVGAFFGAMTQNTWLQIGCLTLSVCVGAGVCLFGVQHGIERVVKVLMVGLFIILLVLVVHSLTLPGAAAGLSFYLLPDAERFQQTGFLPICSAALNQAFFTLSIGIGAMCIFGSYMPKGRSLAGEAVFITILDFTVAMLAGFIIFPACFTFGVEPTSGPGLVFVTLPNVFANMNGGNIWGALFFVFMAIAAFTTVIAVFENMVSYCMDMFAMRRTKATIVNFVLLWIVGLPCALGFSVLSDFQPFGPGSSVLDLEDFIVSNNLLPLGGLLFALFCTMRQGWGWDKFLAEANNGAGLHIHPGLRFYLRWILPTLIIILFVMGYVDKFCK